MRVMLSQEMNGSGILNSGGKIYMSGIGCLSAKQRQVGNYVELE